MTHSLSNTSAFSRANFLQFRDRGTKSQNLLDSKPAQDSKPAPNATQTTSYESLTFILPKLDNWSPPVHAFMQIGVQ